MFLSSFRCVTCIFTVWWQVDTKVILKFEKIEIIWKNSLYWAHGINKVKIGHIIGRLKVGVCMNHWVEMDD